MHLPTSCAIQIFGDRVDAGLRVHLDLDDGGRIRVRGRGTDAGAAVAPGGGRRRVGADRAERAELRLGGDGGLREAHPLLRVFDVEHAAAVEAHALGGDRRASRSTASTIICFARSAAWMRRVAGHQGDARGIRAEIHRRQVRVARDDPDVEGIDAQHLRHDRREDRVGALADVRRAAEHRNAPAAVDLQLHARLGHGVPVDRQARAAEVGGAREAEAPSRRQLAAPLLPAGGLDDLVDAGAEADRADAQEVRGQRVRGLQVVAADRGRVEAEVAGDPVELRPPARSAAAACRGRAWGRTAACS